MHSWAELSEQQEKKKEHMQDQNARSLQMTDLQSFKWLKIKDSSSWTIKKMEEDWEKTAEKLYNLFLTCCIFSLSSYFPMEQRKHQSLCRRVEKDYLKRQILNQRPRGTWSSFPTSTTAPGLLCLCLGAWGTQACQHSPKKKLILLEMARLIFPL